ncbi:LysR family transcriptional regulator [Paraburkholderia phenoliruptrix]|uniref:HTH-type transcriptional regulator CatM n=2 Tax=Paraburkholderia phenoliruptrix TaxID=252970 RepID=A0A6J5K6V0_9BURK|nr:LysR family transcriptional regulator [Paraburkholderia phenoliruptrix]AFT86144.1 LysR family transcriptional regulator [Paraburkholderia phenoliruptrix BR3459a]MDR6388836.1 DNA-binding transcriptional LysR family regulator [Paraburkholderia phenoliruptrix]CAB4048694.1 HTH-type transcriptional regulator CatM [Paraburkholderia phenoliruptrix]
MELRHLRYFIAVAELRSVRAASEQLHVTQPAISRQIHDLEDAVGAALFERTPRGLKLTAAGTAYLAQARDILTRVDAANRLARRIAAGVHGHLRIGFVENAAWIGVVSHALSAFEQSSPHVALELTPMNSPEQFEAIAAGQLDGGFCYRLGTLPQGLASIPVLEQNVVLAVPQAWPLGATGAVMTSELAGRPFIAFPRRIYPAYYDRLLSACAERGLTLDIRQEASTETAILSLVSAGMGAAIVNAANRYRPPARVRFVELRDLSVPLPLEFCFASADANPALARFVEQLR